MNEAGAVDTKPVIQSPRKKCVLLIIDGLGDLPIPEFNGETPLESAHTPLFDKLAGGGRYGLVDPIKPGVVPNTHSGTGMLMGLLPEQLVHLYRGPVEAAGAGLELEPGDIAMRINFATVEQQDDGLLLRDRRAGRISSDTDELAGLLSNIDLGDGVRGTLLPTDQHRGVLVLSGPGLDATISNTDPGNCAMPVVLKKCTALKPEAELTATKVNQFIALAHSHLSGHPINRARVQNGLLPASGIITRGAGPQLFLDNVLRDLGVKTAIVSGCNTVLGVGRMFGSKPITRPGFTTTVDTDLNGKIAAVSAALADHDLVYVHVKAPDNCSHDLQPLAKRKFLERLDAAMAPLMQLDLVLAIAADHSTDSNTGFHTADPVPALICTTVSGRFADPVRFGETSCGRGNMARQLSHEFLLKVLHTSGYSIA